MGRAGWAGRRGHGHGHAGLGLHSQQHTEHLNHAAPVPRWALKPFESGVAFLELLKV